MPLYNRFNNPAPPQINNLYDPYRGQAKGGAAPVMQGPPQIGTSTNAATQNPGVNHIGGDGRTHPQPVAPNVGQWSSQGAGAPQYDTGVGSGSGADARVPYAHGTPEFGSAFYRHAATSPGAVGSNYWLDRANRAFENPLPFSPGAAGQIYTDNYGNQRFDFTPGGAQFGNATGQYNRGDATHPNGLLRTPPGVQAPRDINGTPRAPASVTRPFSPVTNEGYVQRPGLGNIRGTSTPRIR